jgi:hypothetical protein
MCDAMTRRLEQLLMQLETQMTNAEAKLGRALELENRTLAQIEQRLRLLEARDGGDEETQRIAFDDLDMRVTLLFHQLGRLSAQFAILTGGMIAPGSQVSEPVTLDPPID